MNNGIKKINLQLFAEPKPEPTPEEIEAKRLADEAEAKKIADEAEAKRIEDLVNQRLEASIAKVKEEYENKLFDERAEKEAIIAQRRKEKLDAMDEADRKLELEKEARMQEELARKAEKEEYEKTKKEMADLKFEKQKYSLMKDNPEVAEEIEKFTNAEGLNAFLLIKDTIIASKRKLKEFEDRDKESGGNSMEEIGKRKTKEEANIQFAKTLKDNAVQEYLAKYKK